MTDKKDKIDEVYDDKDIFEGSEITEADFDFKDGAEKIEFTKIPLIPLRAVAVIPSMVTHFDVGREKSILALEKAMEENGQVFLVMQKDASIENPKQENLYEYGTIANVKQVLRLPGRTCRILVEGLKRAKLEDTITVKGYYTAIVSVPESSKAVISESNILEAMHRKLTTLYEEYVTLLGRISHEGYFSAVAADDIGTVADAMVGSMVLKPDIIQSFIEELDGITRAEKLLPLLINEIEILKLERDLATKVKSTIDDKQKEYYLREQLKAIQEELGEYSEGIDEDEMSEFIKAIDSKRYPQEIRTKLKKEMSKLSKMSAMSPEASVIRSYMETLIELPFGIETKEKLDIKYVRKILERDHYGLGKVKERIIEYIAAKKLSNDFNSPILCLVGPPGTGKTSIVKSIAESINRKYVRMSLGGIKDEAEIRGHRRTYIGSMPGRVAKAIKQAGSMNPLILFDEIDKLGSDFRGDPASAMLEVLDAEQNNSFRDHYLEISLDLSHVMFITTANTTETIPRPLLDRMEIIEVTGYTEEEKMHIANKYIIPKQLKKHGMTKKHLSFTKDVLEKVISNYTRESGVRNLEREIASLCRKAATRMQLDETDSIKITVDNIEDFLGPKRYLYDTTFDQDDIGIARGLAWTQVGGDTLTIEVNIMTGTGHIELTGRLGDVMKESAKAAIGYIRSQTEKLGINPDFYKDKDIHVHVPEGAVPKDGPSAGITLATAIISALSGKKVRRDVAMTGEITLRGRVLPIGGLKEKLSAARRAKVKQVLIPMENVRDLVDVPKQILDEMQITPVKTMDDVLKNALAE
ncbi:MAG: endopeptidase La [Clostridia bacterium]|jgi:ATP-dependent Lon protease